jgi:hypothetical protein
VQLLEPDGDRRHACTLCPGSGRDKDTRLLLPEQPAIACCEIRIRRIIGEIELDPLRNVLRTPGRRAAPILPSSVTPTDPPHIRTCQAHLSTFITAPARQAT